MVSRFFTEVINRILPAIFAFSQLGCLLASHLCTWHPGPFKTTSRPMHPAVLPLCDQARGYHQSRAGSWEPACSHLSAQSSGTELRAAPPKLRDALKTLWNALRGVNETSPLCSTSAATKVNRPTVLVQRFPGTLPVRLKLVA